MQKIIYLLVFCGFILWVQCGKDHSVDVDEDEIIFYKTVPGGCNDAVFEAILAPALDDIDTVEYTLLDDTLAIFVGLNYICCAPFTTEATIVNDTLKIAIRDTCTFPFEACYCRCMCYYTWDFKFVHFTKKEYHLIIELTDPREEEILLIKKGRIDF